MQCISLRSLSIARRVVSRHVQQPTTGVYCLQLVRRGRLIDLRGRHARRNFSIDTLSAILLPPAIFTGLLSSLWFYKCCMMVIFQNKIIYMPGVPPFARQEKIAEYARQCHPVVWREERIKTEDAKEIALCVGAIQHRTETAVSRSLVHVVIVYFQGNASSMPPRLPYLSDVLRSVERLHLAGEDETSVTYTIVALSYRGYWTSRGRPSQLGIELDARAALSWVKAQYDRGEEDVRVVLWGQSIGAGIATTAAAQLLSKRRVLNPPTRAEPFPFHALILETPFVSIRSMLVALYPQRWLPYRYLGPFLRNWWDSKAALRQIADASRGPSQARGFLESPKILLLQAGKDELVPREQAIELEELCRSLGFAHVERRNIPGALHTEVVTRVEGRRAIAEALISVGRAKQST